MSLLQQERFSRLQFPVHKVTAQTPVELFEILPGLRRYFQRLTNEGDACYRGPYADDLVKVIKYIVFVYDPESDLLSEYPDDFRLLKETAAKEAGFKRNKDGEFPLYVQDIIDFKEKQITGFILDYLKVKKNAIWTEIKFIEEELDSMYRSRAKAISEGTIKADLMNLIKTRIEERENLYKRFYAEHSDLKKATQDDIYPVSPENVFKELKIPPEIWKVRQVKDVSKTPGVPETNN
jgi:hypothetical protein